MRDVIATGLLCVLLATPAVARRRDGERYHRHEEYERRLGEQESRLEKYERRHGGRRQNIKCTTKAPRQELYDGYRKIRTAEEVRRQLHTIEDLERWEMAWHIDSDQNPAFEKAGESGVRMLTFPIAYFAECVLAYATEYGFDQETRWDDWHRMGYEAYTTDQRRIVSAVKNGKELKTSDYGDRWLMARDFISTMETELRRRESELPGSDALEDMNLAELRALARERERIRRSREEEAEMRGFLEALGEAEDIFRELVRRRLRDTR